MKELKRTRILYANTPKELHKICKIAGFIRADIWRRYGGIKNHGKETNKIRKEITTNCGYANLDIDGTIRAETTKDIVNDILAYRAAAKKEVKKAIFKRTKEEEEQKRLFRSLKSNRWLDDPFLHRKMRKFFRHGISHTKNQFVVNSDRSVIGQQDGFLTITIKIAPKYGKDITLITTSNGKNVDLMNKNLRIIVKDIHTEIHYSMENKCERPCGNKTLGIDKGYTECFVDSEGEHHGVGFGTVITKYSDKVAKRDKGRSRLHALEKKYRKSGKIQKADNIRVNNLGCKKLNSQKHKNKQKLRDITFKAVHSVVDKAKKIVSEDLTHPISKKHPWKKYNRKMNSWSKGVLAEAIETVCKQRGANHQLVNCAYTSQMDSKTGLLEGKRVGDKFYRANGDVLQADHNAAMNVLARANDSEIKLYTSHKEVKRILLARSPTERTVNRHE